MKTPPEGTDTSFGRSAVPILLVFDHQVNSFETFGGFLRLMKNMTFWEKYTITGDSIFMMENYKDIAKPNLLEFVVCRL